MALHRRGYPPYPLRSGVDGFVNFEQRILPARFSPGEQDLDQPLEYEPHWGRSEKNRGASEKALVTAVRLKERQVRR